MWNPTTEYESLLRELHRTVFVHGNDSPEAEAVREKMERSESWLTPEQAQRMKRLSEELYKNA